MRDPVVAVLSAMRRKLAHLLHCFWYPGRAETLDNSLLEGLNHRNVSISIGLVGETLQKHAK